MDTMMENLREELLSKDTEFRELAREHGRFEARLSELAALTYPNDQEQMEESVLKKKKLAVKDQMHLILTRHLQSASTVH